MGESVGMKTSRERHAADERVVDAPFDGASTGRRRRAGVALRVHVEEQGLRSAAATLAARLTAVVVLPTPPFWLTTAMTCVRVRSRVQSPTSTLFIAACLARLCLSVNPGAIPASIALADRTWTRRARRRPRLVSTELPDLPAVH